MVRNPVVDSNKKRQCGLFKVWVLLVVVIEGQRNKGRECMSLSFQHWVASNCPEILHACILCGRHTARAPADDTESCKEKGSAVR